MKDLSFLGRHVDLYNCGQHDLDNSYMFECDLNSTLEQEVEAFMRRHEDCVPVGICEENRDWSTVALVFEDQDGNRYFTHVPEYWLREYEVLGDPEAMMKAKHDYLAGNHKHESNRAPAWAKPLPPDEDFRTDEEEPEKEEPEKEESEKEEPVPEEPPVQLGKKPVFFKFNAVEILEDIMRKAEENGEAGNLVALRFLCRQLYGIANRAIELDDPRLHILLLSMGLYEGVEDIDAEIQKMKEKLEKGEK